MEEKLFKNSQLLTFYANAYYQKINIYIDSDWIFYRDYQHKEKYDFDAKNINQKNMTLFLNSLTETRINNERKLLENKILEKIVDFKNKEIYDIYELIEKWKSALK